MFADLEEAHALHLCELASLVEVPRRTRLVQAGAESEGAFLLVSGKVKVFLTGDDGREVILSTLSAGEVFGEMGLIDDLPRSAHVETLEASTIAVIGKPDFLDCLSKSGELALAVMRNLAARLRAADEQIERLALLSVEERVVQFLLDHSVLRDGRREVAPPSKQDIGRMVGASREMVSRVMRSLEESGRISLHGKTVRFGGADD